MLRTMFRNDLQRVWASFISLNQANFNYRQNSGSFRWSTLLLYMIFFLAGGVVLFYLAQFFGGSDQVSGWLMLLAFVGLLILITLGRMFVLSGMRSVFPFGKELGFYQFNIAQFNFLLGLVFFPLGIALAFGTDNIREIVVWLTLGSIGLIYALRTLRGLFIARQYLMFHKFHFFLYLCTVEIAPMLILFKLVTNWGSVT